MGWNPANWQLTDTLQGQQGGFTNPLAGVSTPVSQLGGLGGSNVGSVSNLSAPSNTSDSPYEGQMYYDNGSVYSYRNGQWVAGNGQTNANDTGVLGTSNTRLGGGSTAPAYDPGTIALYDNQIGTANSALGRIGNQREIGLGNINKSYDEATGQLAGDRSAAEGAYNLQKDRTGQDYTNTRSSIRSDAGNQFGSIQRLLGSKGAGRSSAAQVLAPFAVGKEAASRFGQVQNQFGRNQQDMDTSYATTTGQFDDYATQLENDKEQKRKDLESGLASTETGLQDQIAQLNLKRANEMGTPLATALQAIAPQQSRIQQLLNSIDEYGRNTSVALKGRGTYQAPELAQYNYSRFDAPQLQGGGYDPQADYVSPLTSLLKKDKKIQ